MKKFTQFTLISPSDIMSQKLLGLFREKKSDEVESKIDRTFDMYRRESRTNLISRTTEESKLYRLQGRTTFEDSKNG